MDSENPAAFEDLVNNFNIMSTTCYFDTRKAIDISELKGKNPIFVVDELVGKIHFLFRFEQESLAASIYERGRIYICGARSLNQAERGAEEIVAMLRGAGSDVEKTGNIKQVQLLGTTRFGYKLNLDDIKGRNKRIASLSKDTSTLIIGNSQAYVKDTGEVILICENEKEVGKALESLSELEGLPFYGK